MQPMCAQIDVYAEEKKTPEQTTVPQFISHCSVVIWALSTVVNKLSKHHQLFLGVLLLAK